MIFRMKFQDKEEVATAKSQLHLLQSYETAFGNFQEIESVKEVTMEEAKIERVTNNEYVEGKHPIEDALIVLADLVGGDEFAIIASTEWA